VDVERIEAASECIDFSEGDIVVLESVSTS
jgi:hypothetical protein